jgi:hypothetical protein
MSIFLDGGLHKRYALISSCRAEGNFVNELCNTSLTTLLISAIKKSVPTGRAAKDFELYLGVLRDGELWNLHRIMSDGPSRGTMAIETDSS